MKDVKGEQGTGHRTCRMAVAGGDAAATRLVALNTLLELARAEAAEEAAFAAEEAALAVTSGGEVGR